MWVAEFLALKVLIKIGKSYNSNVTNKNNKWHDKYKGKTHYFTIV